MLAIVHCEQALGVNDMGAMVGGNEVGAVLGVVTGGWAWAFAEMAKVPKARRIGVQRIFGSFLGVGLKIGRQER
jgi:hypothetical protein